MKKRVKIPTNLAAMVALAMRVREKHISDGDTSLLKNLNWEKIEPGLTKTYALQNKAEQLKRELLEVFEKRDQGITLVEKFLRDSRDVLTGTYSDEMKMLGKWGYDVLENRSKKTTLVEASVKSLPQRAE